jgi:heme/copper-type cytochrome/quinol oxidase subunit 3
VAHHVAEPNIPHAEVDEHYTTTGLDHRKLLMWVFLELDCLFFGSLIAT